MPKSSIFFPMNDIASIEFCIWFSSLFISFFQTHHFWTYFLIILPQWNPTWGDFAGENFCKTSSNYILLILLSALSVIRHRICGNNLDWLLNLATEIGHRNVNWKLILLLIFLLNFPIDVIVIYHISQYD